MAASRPNKIGCPAVVAADPEVKAHTQWNDVRVERRRSQRCRGPAGVEAMLHGAVTWIPWSASSTRPGSARRDGRRVLSRHVQYRARTRRSRPRGRRRRGANEASSWTRRGSLLLVTRHRGHKAGAAIFMTTLHHEGATVQWDIKRAAMHFGGARRRVPGLVIAPRSSSRGLATGGRHREQRAPPAPGRRTSPRTYEPGRPSSVRPARAPGATGHREGPRRSSP